MRRGRAEKARGPAVALIESFAAVVNRGKVVLAPGPIEIQAAAGHAKRRSEPSARSCRESVCPSCENEIAGSKILRVCCSDPKREGRSSCKRILVRRDLRRIVRLSIIRSRQRRVPRRSAVRVRAIRRASGSNPAAGAERWDRCGERVLFLILRERRGRAKQQSDHQGPACVSQFHGFTSYGTTTVSPGSSLIFWSGLSPLRTSR